MRRGRRDVRELERLLELCACPSTVAQMEKGLAQAHARERLAPNRT